MVKEYPKPRPGESLLDYSERLNAMEIGSYEPVMTCFGLNATAAKALWVASENFNARFSFQQWKSRRDKSADGYGARNWLKRKYKLNETQVDEVVAGFRTGNESALLDVLSFEQLAHSRLSESAQHELVKLGVLKKSIASTT